MAQRLWPLRCCPKVMNMCSPANAMPDLWRTSLVKDGISLAERATLAWNLQPRLQRPAPDTQDHLWTWKCNKNGATEPSWVKIRSSTGPRETSVPAVPEQLSLLRVPLSAAPCCTDMRNVSDVQSSSRTALAVSVVHLLTETMSWPRQSLTLHTCGYCSRRPTGHTFHYVLTFGFSSHSTHWIVVKLPGLVVQVGVSQFLW